MREYINTNVETPIDFLIGGQFISGEKWKHMRRKIDIYVAIININNELYIEQNGKQSIIMPGDVYFLLPDQLHAGYKYSKAGSTYYWFHFFFPSTVKILSYSAMNQEVSKLRSTPYTTANKKNSSIFLPVHSTPKYIERIQILCKQLMDVYKANYYNNFCVDYLATSLLVELSEQTITNLNTSLEKSDPEKKLDTIIEWMRVHSMSNTISVSKIADEFNYNRDYLSRIFKKETGMNIQEYINMLKLSKAKELLARTNESIKMIAFTVGINDEKYFMRLFKKYEKMTPSDYRKAYYRMPMNNE